MPEGQTKREQKVDRALIAFMSELAQYLVAAGIGSARFASIVRLAYFQAASAHGRFTNERLNQSAVAAMTGLTRMQVRSFARQSAPLPSETRERVDQVIEGWTTDSRFATAEHLPRKLRITGRGNTFGFLAKIYGADVPARSLLREMQRHGYVAVRDGNVSLRRKVHETCDEARVRRISQALAALLRDAANSAPCGTVRTVTVETTYPATSEKGRHLLQRITSDRLREFLAGIEAAGVAAALEAPPGKKQKGKTTRTRIALITEDLL